MSSGKRSVSLPSEPRVGLKWEQRTPAMAAGLTDHAWSLEELLMCHVPAAPG